MLEDTLNLHLTDFNEAERTDYMMVVASMAGQDGAVTSEEIYAVRQLSLQFVLGPEARGKVMAATATPPENMDEIIDRLAQTDLRYSLLLDLAAMAYRDEVFSAAVDSAAAQGITAGDRVLSVLGWATPGEVVDNLLAVFAAGASLVQVANPDAALLDRRRITEKVTRDLSR